MSSPRDRSNKVPPIGSTVTLRDGRTGKVASGWYAKGKGGWLVNVEIAEGYVLRVRLRDIAHGRS